MLNLLKNKLYRAIIWLKRQESEVDKMIMPTQIKSDVILSAD